MKVTTISEIKTEMLVLINSDDPIKIRKRKKEDALLLDAGIEVRVVDENGDEWVSFGETKLTLRRVWHINQERNKRKWKPNQ